MVEIISHLVNPILPRNPLHLSEDQRLIFQVRSDALHAATSPARFKKVRKIDFY